MWSIRDSSSVSNCSEAVRLAGAAAEFVEWGAQLITELTVKGISRYLVGEGVDAEKVRFHVSELEAGGRSHAAHTHGGVEAFYVLDGKCAVEIDGERHILDSNESMILDASRPHGISNAGTTRARYLVIIAS